MHRCKYPHIFHLHFVDNAVVKTCKGTGKENPCVFPFLDDGMKFYSCTLNNYDQLWCATEEVTAYTIEYYISL